ncbi:MAG: deoxyguanosinetriphosphate triphosphohydrolase [Clostridiales bacterium]|jgi:dGTPase|nr:deoxyguanosinetriphosphate triphosphohydrolase [Clostridiales bacterium]
MNIRESIEKNELLYLSEFAAKSVYSKGREKSEQKCDMRTEFQRDRDRVVHSKSFRRLVHKTQVFISPEGDHFRTRLTHTLEVSQISRSIARALFLNEDLTEAIALAHDIGHTPFGHTGEEALKEILTDGFEHNKQSVKIVEHIEKNGAGLNLTYEVLDGILNHRSDGEPSTLEGKIVQLSDKIAYINHDIDDAIRAGLLKHSDLPKDAIGILGDTGSKRINFLIHDVIENSYGKNEIKLNKDVYEAIYGLRAFLFNTVYLSQLQIAERKKIKNLVLSLYNYYSENNDVLPEDFKKLIDGNENISAADYVASMTDRFALKQYSSIFLPSVRF